MPYKRNNPGNIRPGVSFKGSTPDGAFLKFDTLSNGFRAIFLDIEAKRKRGVKTLSQYFSEYAPKKDNNNPEAYARFIATKIGQDTIPTRSDTLVSMALAMAQLEHGKAPTNEDLQAAIKGQQEVKTRSNEEIIPVNFLSYLIPFGLAAYFLPKIFK